MIVILMAIPHLLVKMQLVDVGVIATSAAATSVATALIVSVVGLFVDWLRRRSESVVAVIRRKLRPDHATIVARQHAHSGLGGLEFYVAIACAPSRRLTHPNKLEPAAIDSFVCRSWPRAFPRDPEYCVPSELIRYRSVLPESPSEGSTFAIRPDGLIEFIAPIAHTMDEDRRALVDLGALARTVIHAFDVVATSWSALLLTSRLRSRRKLDWYVAVSSSISLTTGWTPLSGFIFPGRPPDRHATGGYPTTPPSGYGGTGLWNRRSSDDVIELAAIAIRDLLERAGYWHFEASLDDLVRLLHSGKETSTTTGPK
jgi:hypothetical protein